MNAITPDTGNLRMSEPRPIIPPLAGFYSHTRDLSWLVVRLTAGGMLLVHGIMKVMPMTEKMPFRSNFVHLLLTNSGLGKRHSRMMASAADREYRGQGTCLELL